jgi:carbonic anhydrase/acetyltransferase-like protein (isoleucine patch superfamily)
MLRCEITADEPLASIFAVFPNLVIDNPLFIPIEWIPIWSKFIQVSDQLLTACIKKSIPQHLDDCFASVSPDGALYSGPLAEDVVLQPGSVLQAEVDLGSRSMLMPNSIALFGSRLPANSFAPPNSVVLPTGEYRPVSETASIEFPVTVKRGVTIGDNVVVLRECRVGSGVILRPGSFLGKRVWLGKGSVVAGGSLVPAGTRIPFGFTYRSAVVELCREIPEVIWRAGNWFIRRKSGFVTLALAMEIGISHFWEYFTLMRFFPREAGRQLALNCHSDLPVRADKLFELFGVYCLSVCIEYWNWRSGSGSEPLEKVLRELAAAGVENFADCFRAGRYQERFEFLLHVCLNLWVLRELGIGEEAVALLQKRIFEHADENMIRLTLVKSPEAMRMLPILGQLIEVTRFGPR